MSRPLLAASDRYWPPESGLAAQRGGAEIFPQHSRAAELLKLGIDFGQTIGRFGLRLSSQRLTGCLQDSARQQALRPVLFSEGQLFSYCRSMA
jgi:hypothetical protein